MKDYNSKGGWYIAAETGKVLLAVILWTIIFGIFAKLGELLFQ
jgi:hypothetical protein